MELKSSDFDYRLSKELIAQRPPKNRSDSRLLVLEKSNTLKLHHMCFKDILSYFEEGDVLVINQTRVLKAKLLGRKTTGSKIELILSPEQTGWLDGTESFCRIKGKVRAGTRLIFGQHTAVVQEKTDQNTRVRFSSKIKTIIDDIGQMPTPPYVKEELKHQDRYQTIYAKVDGSVAAPTAGFHFTPELLKKIREKGIRIVKITLHVSFGTFIPIRSKNALLHEMDKEYFSVSESAAKTINGRKGRLFVVGTTSLKALESAAEKDGLIKPMSGWSGLYLTPAYKYRVDVYGLITNFHLPKSTLILLVSGFIGTENILRAYEEAITKKYRFYSFGDAMLIIKD